MASFRGTSVVKDRGVSIIVKYVPISHSPDTLVEGEQIECVSGLSRGALISTR